MSKISFTTCGSCANVPACFQLQFCQRTVPSALPDNPLARVDAADLDLGGRHRTDSEQERIPAGMGVGTFGHAMPGDEHRVAKPGADGIADTIGDDPGPDMASGDPDKIRAVGAAAARMLASSPESQRAARNADAEDIEVKEPAPRDLEDQPTPPPDVKHEPKPITLDPKDTDALLILKVRDGGLTLTQVFPVPKPDPNNPAHFMSIWLGNNYPWLIELAMREMKLHHNIEELRARSRLRLIDTAGNRIEP